MSRVSEIGSSASISGYTLAAARRLWRNTYRMRQAPQGDFSFSREIALRMTAEDQQHGNITIFGQSGSGKSTVAIRLGEMIDRHLNEILGTEPEYHFSLDNVAIGDRAKSQELNERMQVERQKVYVFDEGVEETYNRDAMTKNNKALVKIAAVARTQQHCIIRCVQKKSMIDPQVLDLGTHEIQIVDPHHEEGYNIVKIKRLALVADSSKLFRTYLSPNGRDRIVRHVIYMPNAERYAVYKGMRVDGGVAIMDRELKKANEVPQEGRTARQVQRDALCEKAWNDYLDMSHAYKTLAKCAYGVGIDPKTLRMWMGRNGRSEGERVRE